MDRQEAPLPALRVLLLNPPFLARFSRPQRSPAVTRSGTLYMPLWLASLGAVLENQGYDILFIDAPAEGIGLPETVRRAETFAPALAVLDTSTPSIAADLDAARAIKERLPGCFVVLVGPHASALPAQCLAAAGPDAVARREYEDTVRDVARVLAASCGPPPPGALAEIPGLSWREGDAVRHNPDRPFLADLDALPFVSRFYRRHLDIRRYFNPNAAYPMVTLITSRGCPGGCTFCLYPQTMTGHRLRRRSVDNVLDEIAWVLDAFPEARSLFFEDDTLTVDVDRCLALCDGIAARGLRFAWTANARADLPGEVMRRMRQAGCRMLCVGFESADAAALAAMRKGIQPGGARRFMRDAASCGMRVHGCWMFGLPDDTRESVLRSIELACALGTDTAQFYPVIPYPGTAIHADYAARGWLPEPERTRWLTATGRHASVAGNGHLTPAEIEELCALARRRFYLRPGYLARRLFLAMGSADEFRRTVMAGRRFIRHLLPGAEK
ncbi:radical SAM protein [Desulfovibrio sulfodismutans]|uniref:Radical SAM protein n=1 Tax=Desulfolutivibrio sulfodismutans TaxID=63561 RepID=A0A7K3NR44_9BACT|nr:radical SAM protein [Desulfolutivibrio sulfodismutans]NDY58658.1 radical SAM protein [Desulfolutivibrio sulfodismutans]QLA12837.1 radical SAM protein [Desulfolutivibrio sulfodismutans DSM 3696]